MQRAKAAGCRVFQAAFHVGAMAIRWRKAVKVGGAGAAERVPDLLEAMGARRPMVVTGPVLTASGVARAVLEPVERAGIPYCLCDGAAPDPTVGLVEEIYARYRREGCDSFVAVGGGSAVDAAKAAAARAVRPDRTVLQMEGLMRVGRRLPPFVAVPTTAGAGSETTIAAVITDEKTRRKAALMDVHLVPQYAVLDPKLTVTLPPAATAAAGMDVLTHAVESYLSWCYRTRESIRCAEEAAALVFRSLERAYRDGGDLEARETMLNAAYSAGFAFTRAGVGNVHALAHALGGLYGTPHGLANAVLLPVVLEDYGAAVWPKLALLAERTGVRQSGTEEQRAKAFLQAVREENRRLGIPERLDIQDRDIPQMAAWAEAEANPLYPVPVLYDRERFQAVLQRVRAGK